VGLTGTPDQIQKVTKAYRVYYSKPPKDNSPDYLVDHSIFMYLLDREGNFIDYFGISKDEDDIVAALKKHISERDKIPLSFSQRIKQFFLSRRNRNTNNDINKA
jgi:cytochrome oxidase Cu insertion factor (SCO1/SenC/PrrC family)